MKFINNSNRVLKIICTLSLGMLMLGCGTSSEQPDTANSDTTDVQNVSELTIALNSVEAGDTILLKNGNYKNVSISIVENGTKEKPITIKAKNKGQVTFSGDMHLSILGDYIIISGIHFTNGAREKPANLILDKGNHNEYAYCKFDHLNDVKGLFIKLEGRYTRVHHCSFDGKTTEESFINIDIPQQGGSKAHIYRNYFSRRGPIGGNKSAIRVGYGGIAFRNGYNTIEENLFDNCDSETEVVSVKSSRNYLLHNTFLNSVGSLSLRHGSGSIVEGNYFIHNQNDLSTGKRADKTGGIVVRGSNHYIVNNYLYDLDHEYRINEEESGAITFGAGSDEYIHNDSSNPLLFAVAKDVVVAYNTVISNRSKYDIDFLLGYGSRNRTNMPKNIQFYNNVFDESQEFMHSSSGVEADFYANFYAGSGLSQDGVQQFTLKTMQQFNIPVPTANNVFKDQSVETPDQPDYQEFSNRDFNIEKDIFERPRDAQRDAGSFEVDASGMISNPPLTKQDVGCGF